MPPRRTRLVPIKTPWDRPRKNESTASQDIRDTRDWLMSTYGGSWGKLKLAAERAEVLEAKVVSQAATIRRLRKAMK